MKTLLKLHNIINSTILLFLLIACSPNEKVPKDFPDEDEMAQILADIHYTESIISQARRNLTDNLTDDDIPGYYRNVLDKYNLSAEQFDSIRDWYSAHPYHYQKVYDKVIVLLSKKEAELNQLLKAKEEQKDSLHIIRDLWNTDRIMKITPNDTTKSFLPFEVKTDSIIGGQIRLSAVYKFLREDLSKNGKTIMITQYADSTTDTISLELSKTFKNNPITLQTEIDSLNPLIQVHGFLFEHDTSDVTSIEFSDIRLEHFINKGKEPKIKEMPLIKENTQE
ncbi:DUF4296 domain-containing protein [Thermophagus xiamenensis]|uniref:DUF4296 domain-containing protein n=1 Tax=Thermophagus xiamenensis TaxID=385682 RepID=A0A1I2DHI2_9BACT|nr:DUF4296 domain-containing protein [Thermophagus xiamenensis]SFE80072.1 protein of unknown function [Thermophagus xiamenensis]